MEFDWTHKNIKILDIRKLSKFYAISIDSTEVTSPLFVKDAIFEERVKSYFLKDAALVSREEILSHLWNLYLTKGYYVKIENGKLIEYHPTTESGDTPSKWYVSYLELAGNLGNFASITRDKEK